MELVVKDILHLPFLDFIECLYSTIMYIINTIWAKMDLMEFHIPFSERKSYSG